MVERLLVVAGIALVVYVAMWLLMHRRWQREDEEFNDGWGS